jgi:hypothetical protein
MRFWTMAAVAAILGFAASRAMESTALFGASLAVALAASAAFALETIRKREEYISRDDSGGFGYLQGFQAVTSGLAHLILCLGLGVPVVAFLLGFGAAFLNWLSAEAWLPCLIFGVWIAVQSLGVIAGQALSAVGAVAEGPLDRAMVLINAGLEKIIHLILFLVGLGMILLGCAAFVAGTGPLELLLALL